MIKKWQYLVAIAVLAGGVFLYANQTSSDHCSTDKNVVIKKDACCLDKPEAK